MKKMKKNISYGLTALLFAVIFTLALALIGCGNKDDKTPDPECDCTVKVHPAPCDCPAAGTPACDCTVIQRTFTIDGFVKPITVTDARTGDNDTDLETLGVISRLKTALTENSQTTVNFATVVNRNLTIIVEDTTTYGYFKRYSGNKLGINFAWISSANIDMDDFMVGLEVQLDLMSSIVLCDCAETYGTTAHLGIDGNGNVAACPCPADEKPCGCTEQTAALDGIAIRKQAGISVADMNAAVANIGNVYNGNDMFPADRTKFKTKVTQIHIVSGNGVVLEGTVLKVGSGATETAIFDCIADYVLQ